jgi:hypothetical protein
MLSGRLTWASAAPRRDLARRFGSETGDRVNKFDRAWDAGPADLPILTEAMGWFAG